LARIHITTATTGISAPGTVYRMDEVPLTLRPPLQSPYPTDVEVIRRIRAAVKARVPDGMMRGPVMRMAGITVSEGVEK
jgi:formylmethanofuran dehydrogenase subunit B